MRRHFGRRVGVAVAGLALVAAAQCHTTSTGLASIDARSDSPTYRLSLTPSELGEAGADIARGAAGEAASAQRVGQWL